MKKNNKHVKKDYFEKEFNLKKEFYRTIRKEIYFLFVIACCITILMDYQQANILFWIILFLFIDIFFNPENKILKERIKKALNMK